MFQSPPTMVAQMVRRVVGIAVKGGLGGRAGQLTVVAQCVCRPRVASNECIGDQIKQQEGPPSLNMCVLGEGPGR